MNNKELALDLIHAGYRVIPCYPRGHEHAKAPMASEVPSWPKDAAKDDYHILKWFGGPVPKLIGLPCEINGFFAVDVDGPEAAATWQAWIKQFGMSEPGPWQKTTHGAHYLFKNPAFKVPGKIGALAPGIDLRGPNYICTGGDGTGYEWQIPFTEPIPEAPEWLLNKIRALLAPAAAMPELTELAGKAPDNPDAVLSYWFNKYTDEARQGTRDDCAYRLGLQLYRSRIPIGTALNLGLQYTQAIPQPSGAPYTQAEYSRAIRSSYDTMPKEAATLPREVRQPAAAKIESIKAPDKPKAAPKPKPVEDPEKSAEFSTWADLDAVLGPIEWEWPGWLAKGFLHILVGEVGGGKSSIALRIGRTYLTGLAWPDGTQYSGAHGCILWGEAEAAQAMNRDRAKFMDLPTDKILSPLGDPLGDFRLNNRDHQTKLTIMAMKPEVKLIVIDSLSGADPTAEKSTEDAKNVNWLAALARDIQKPIILTHHLRKRGMFDTEGIVSLDRVRGISTILQYARVIWAIEAPDREAPDAKRLSVIKSNIAKKPDPIGFIIDDEIVFGPAPENPRAETAKDRGIEALRELLSRGEVAASQIENDFKGLALSKRAMYEAKKALVVISVKRADGWYWRLPVKKENGFYG